MVCAGAALDGEVLHVIVLVARTIALLLESASTANVSATPATPKPTAELRCALWVWIRTETQLYALETVSVMKNPAAFATVVGLASNVTRLSARLTAQIAVCATKDSAIVPLVTLEPTAPSLLV